MPKKNTKKALKNIYAKLSTGARPQTAAAVAEVAAATTIEAATVAIRQQTAKVARKTVVRKGVGRER